MRSTSQGLYGLVPRLPLLSTSTEYKPREKLDPRLILGNQFMMQLAQVVTSFAQTLLIWMHLVWIQCTCTSTVVVCVLFQQHHFCLTELEGETFKRRRRGSPNENGECQYGVQAQCKPRSHAALVSTSTEYKPLASLTPGSSGEHQCSVQSVG